MINDPCDPKEAYSCAIDILSRRDRSVKELSKVRRIINRDYLEDVVSQTTEELRKINRFLGDGLPISLETVYQEFSPVRQSFIQPLFPTSEEVVEEIFRIRVLRSCGSSSCAEAFREMTLRQPSV